MKWGCRPATPIAPSYHLLATPSSSAPKSKFTALTHMTRPYAIVPSATAEKSAFPTGPPLRPRTLKAESVSPTLWGSNE